MAAQKLTKHYQKPWQLLVSVCLTRTNTVTKELTDIETRYAELMEKVELENSVYNDYETRKLELNHVMNRTGAQQQKKLSEKEEEKITEASRMLANIQDQEDIWAQDTAKLQAASKTSSHDNNKQSPHRLIDQTLHMSVRDDSLLNEPSTVLPYTPLNEAETLRQASERLLETYGIPTSNTLFLSNAPCGVIKIRFKENEERGQVFQGAKVFFTKVRMTSLDNIDTQNTQRDWLSVSEIQEQSQSEYFQRLERFL